ncbi:MAG TPA: mersacidin/lichenicidin family type 2 lantibiotic [Waterburya sp.]|jgi:mersacidin/lichenicidin family type 2 lantibiotic
MSHEDIIRAWKDEEYRTNLSEEERAQLPKNPAGLIDLTDAEMDAVAGGSFTPICAHTTTGKRPPQWPKPVPKPTPKPDGGTGNPDGGAGNPDGGAGNLYEEDEIDEWIGNGY